MPHWDGHVGANSSANSSWADADGPWAEACEGQCCYKRGKPLDICCPGSSGGMLLPMFGEAEQKRPSAS